MHETIAQYFRSLKEKCTVSLGRCLDEAVCLSEPQLGKLQGRSAILDYFGVFFKSVEDVAWETSDTVEDGDRVLVFSWRGMEFAVEGMDRIQLYPLGLILRIEVFRGQRPAQHGWLLRPPVALDIGGLRISSVTDAKLVEKKWGTSFGLCMRMLLLPAK